MLKGFRGRILTFHSDPFLSPISHKCYNYWEDGLLVVKDGKIISVGTYLDTYEQYKTINIVEYKDALIMPGFVDCHVHYVQSPMIGSFGATLLYWLNTYTFPMEEKFRDKTFCDEVSKIFFRQLLKNGTTTANVFCTTYPESVDSFFEESSRYNTRMIAGKVLQDRNVSDKLRDTSPSESVKMSENLLNKWHRKGRQLYAVIPRFAIACSDEQMQLAGELYHKYLEQGVYLHTHLNETKDEVAWVKELHPTSKTYTSVYQKYGMLAPNSVFAHSSLTTKEEWQMLHDADCGCAHCPSSNLFLGGGMFRYWEAKDKEHPVKIGIGTDVGGGTDFSIIKELGDAYKVAMMQNKPLSDIHSFYLATRGGAEALHLEDKIGSLQEGMEADFIVLNLSGDEFFNWRRQFCSNIFDLLFIIQTLGLNKLVKETYVYGHKVYDSETEEKYNYATTVE